MIVGVGICAFFTHYDVTYTPFEISEEKTAQYGYFSPTRTAIRGLILEPKEDVYAENGLRPAVFLFHGMFMSKELHTHSGIELARAGFVVIMPDHPGQGESLGVWNLGLDFQALGNTMVDWLFDEANETYDLRINPEWVGSTGHSYGGVTTTALGANRPDDISAAISVWTWGNLTESVAHAFSAETDDMFDSGAWNLVKLSSFPLAISKSYTPSEDELYADLELRNMHSKLNGTPGNMRPRNWLLITGYDDEFATPEQEARAMAYASVNYSKPTSVEQQVETYTEHILDNVTSNPNNTWRKPGGNFTNGSMRQIFLPQNYTTTYWKYMHMAEAHFLEGLYEPTLNMRLHWFGDAWGWDVDEQYYKSGKSINISLPVFHQDFPAVGAIRYWAYGVFFSGFILSLYPLCSYLTKLGRPEEEWQKLQMYVPEKIRNLERKTILKMILGYAIVYITVTVVAVLSVLSILPDLGINPSSIGVPYMVIDGFMLILLLATSLFVAPAIIAILIFEHKKFGISFNEIGLSTRGLGYALVSGISIPLVMALILNVVGKITLFPSGIYPAESPSMGYMGYVMVLIYMLFLMIFTEIFFRGLLQTKLEALILGIESVEFVTILGTLKLISPERFWIKKWISYIVCGVASALIAIIAGGVSIYLLIGGFEITQLPGQMMVMGMSVIAISPWISTYVYQRTRSIIPCILIDVLLFGTVMCSHVPSVAMVLF